MNSRRSSSLIPQPSSLFFATLFLFLGTALAALEIPPPPTQWYTDKAGLLDSAAAAALNDKLAAFEQRSGAQFIIYVFPSLENEALEDFSIRAAEKWKVGNKKYDNGLIIFIFVREQKVRVEVGYGLEGSITDAISSRVIRNDIAPAFQRRDFAGGLNAAADTIIARIEKGEVPREPVAGSGQQGQGGSVRPGGIDFVSVLILLFVFFFFILPLLRRRGGGCGGCFFPMFFPGGGGITFGGGGGGFGGGFGGGGGFSGGGGSFGGGGASGGW